MEVHHHAHNDEDVHSHRGTKKWTHYLWEFLMLFLAVFCGFLAENQREKIVEHHREKEFAKSLLEDLNNDTLDLNKGIPFWTKYMDRIDTIRNEIDKPIAERDLLLLYSNVVRMTTNFTFRYHDRTIMQLKAGNFRLIRSKMVADSLVEYDAVYNTLLRNIQDNYMDLSHYQMTLRDQLFSSRYFLISNKREQLDSAFKKSPETFAIRDGKEDVLFQYYNSLYNLRWLCNVRLNYLKRQQQWAVNLINIIKDEYHFK
jgi:hypothetical protein